MNLSKVRGPMIGANSSSLICESASATVICCVWHSISSPAGETFFVELASDIRTSVAIIAKDITEYSQ